MSLHSTDALIVEGATATESLPDPTTVSGRTHWLHNNFAGSQVWSAGAGTPFVVNGVNSATLTIVRGNFAQLYSDGTRWNVIQVATPGAAAQNFWGGAVNLSGPIGNFAWKGNGFTPTGTITVYGVTVSVNNLLADGATVQGAIVTSAAGAVTTISKTQVYTQVVNNGSQGGQIYLPFVSPVTMTGGVAYQIMVGSNAGGGVTSTTSFPVNSVNGNMFAAHYGAPPGALAVSIYYNMSTLAPIVGTAIASAAHSVGLALAVGLVWS